MNAFSSLRTRTPVLAAIIVLGALGLSACAPAAPPDTGAEPITGSSSPSASPAPMSSSEADADTDADTELKAAFAERDAFLDAQQLPRDGSPLVAITEAQKQLVKEQREWIEAQGLSWTAQDEWILLALASDTCESGIMNQHRIDGEFLATVLTGSPLVQQLIPTDATDAEISSYLRNLASKSVFGAGFLCPDDKDAWQAALAEAFPQ